MILKKIEIENFKSIEKIEFDINTIDDSKTTMLLGINEVGKSNILKAMSYLDVPIEDFNYNLTHNQKNDEAKYVDIFFHFELLNWEKIKKEIIDYFIDKGTKVDSNIFTFELNNFKKNVYLHKDEKLWEYTYFYDLIYLPKNVKSIYNEKNELIELIIINSAIFINPPNTTSKNLEENDFKELLNDALFEIIPKYEPEVSFWKPSDKYLISMVDLNIFKDDINSNIPLKNIFALAGYNDSEKINYQIENARTNAQHRLRLKTTLSKETTKYIKSIWKHNIEIYIDIEQSLICNVSIKDDGEKNECNFYDMDSRSDGFKQFISFILSLSIETKKYDNKNRLILIDEPERHLHPSGIRDLGKELIEMGKNNYVFVSTHSPFLIDKKNKERHIIIKKDSSANTIKKEIKNHIDIRDDEVLNEAFGINLYKDLLLPHNILVEGASDKIMLQKLFTLNNIYCGITNGTGSNITQTASKFNTDDIKVFVIIDDDKDGKKYKKDILKIAGIYNQDNVFTLKDLIGNELPDESTSEDLYDISYVKSQFKKLSTQYEIEERIINDFEFDIKKPYLEQIKIFLLKNKLPSEKTTKLIDELKINLSNDFNPSKTLFEGNIKLVNLINNIKEKFNL